MAGGHVANAIGSREPRALPLARAPLTPFARSVCFGILWFEVVTNVANGVLTLVSPRFALRIMTMASAEDSFDGAAGEAARWFAAVSLAFGGFLLARVLLLRGRARLWALWPLLEALIVGDVLYLSALVPFTLRFASTGVVLPYALTAVMFAARATLLRYEDWELPARGDEAVADGDGVGEEVSDSDAAARLLPSPLQS